MTSRSLIEEITRGLATPERGEKIVDYADGRQGKIIFADRPNRKVSAKFGSKIFRIPFRSLRWDTIKMRWVWWGLREGAGTPGFDVPAVYRVTFVWKGKRYVRDVEVPLIGAGHRNWAMLRGAASALRAQGLDGLQLRRALAQLQRSQSIRTSDVSLDANPDSPGYVPLKRVAIPRAGS